MVVMKWNGEEEGPVTQISRSARKLCRNPKQYGGGPISERAIFLRAAGNNTSPTTQRHGHEKKEEEKKESVKHLPMSGRSMI